MRIIQMFGWKLTDIESNLQKVKEQGFTHIQTSPLQPTKDNGDAWWLQYQPIGLRIGNTQIGSKDDLISLCRKANEIGLKIISDVVLRHVGSDELCNQRPHNKVDKELYKFVLYDRPFMQDESNREQMYKGNCGLPMLNYEDKEFQVMCKRFLDELISCGVNMLRVDMYKHFALPEEGGTFVSEVLSNYNFVGEVLFEENKDLLRRFTDFGYVFSVHSLADKSKLIAAVECHDTYLNYNGVGFTRKMTDEQIMTEYFHLCKHTKNTMFYTRPYSMAWKNELIRIANAH